MNKDEIRDKIILVAGELFQQHGIKSITMNDVAAKMHMSKRTLYETFKDKETLLRECILKQHRFKDEYFKDMMNSSMNVLEILLTCYHRSVENIRNTNYRFFQDIKKYPDLAELLHKNREQESDEAMEYFRRGVEQGLFRNDINFVIMNILLHEQINILIHSDICQQFSFIEVYEVIMLTYIRGLCTEKGLKLLDDYIGEYHKKYDFQFSVRQEKEEKKDE